MTKKIKIPMALLFSLAIIILSIGIGSVYITPPEIFAILKEKIVGVPSGVPTITSGILWNMRLPRVLVAFLVGAALSVSGVVMQSILQNPLASSYTLGVSSGAALGVAVFITLGVPHFAGLFTRPIIGLVGGILTVVLAVGFSSKMDGRLGNQTIILVGMVFSLFINSMLHLVMSMSRATQQEMMNWQMGSFSLKNWKFVAVLFPIAVVGILILMWFSPELDNLTFGEEAALAVGVNVKKMKWVLLCISAALTGCAVSLVGVIGFVDLVIPHIVRRIFGSSHKIVIPMSALLGGCFMSVADVVARTVISPSEVPIGVVTAVIGAPFFIYIYFKGQVKN